MSQVSDDESVDSHDDSQEQQKEEHLLPLEVSKTTKDYEKSEARRKKKRDKKKRFHKNSKKQRGDKNEISISKIYEEAEKKKKLLEALKSEEKRLQQVDRLMTLEERKRPYNSMVESKAPNEEELEAYYMKRKREEDPMAYF